MWKEGRHRKKKEGRTERREEEQEENWNDTVTQKSIEEDTVYIEEDRVYGSRGTGNRERKETKYDG